MKKFLAVVVFCLPAFGQAAYSGSTLYQGAAVYGTAGAPFGFAELPQNWVNPTICNPPGGVFDTTIILGTTLNGGPNATSPDTVGTAYTMTSPAGLQDALNNWRDNADGLSQTPHFADKWWLIEIPAQGSSGLTYIPASTYPANNAAVTYPGKLNPTGNVEPTKCLVIDSQDAVANPGHLAVGQMVCAWGLANFGGNRNPGCDGHILSGAQNDKQYMWKMVLSNLPGFFAGIYAQEDTANPLASSISGNPCRGWTVCVPYANHILIKHGELTLAPGSAQSFLNGPSTAPYFFQATAGGSSNNGANSPGSPCPTCTFIPGIWSTNLGVVGMYMHGWDPGDPGQPSASPATGITAISGTGSVITYTVANTFAPNQIVNITSSGTGNCTGCVITSIVGSGTGFKVAGTATTGFITGGTATQIPTGACGSWTNTSGTGGAGVSVTPDGAHPGTSIVTIPSVGYASNGSYFGMTFTPTSTIYINGTAQTIANTTYTRPYSAGLTTKTSRLSVVLPSRAHPLWSPILPHNTQSVAATTLEMRCSSTSDGGWLQDNYIEKIHDWNSESHGVGTGFIYGPLKIVNNWIEGGSAALFAGGAAVDTNGGPMYDAEIRRNHLGADLNWRQLTGGGGASPYPPFGCGPPDGTQGHDVCPFKWGRKNSLELKIGSRVLIAGNEIEDDWVDGQDAYCISIDARAISGGSMAGVYNGSNVPLTFTDNVRIESNWNANCGQNAFAGQSSTPGNGGGVSKKLAKIDVVNNLWSNLSDNLQNGKAGSEWEWTSGEIKYPCAMSASGGNATATCAPYQDDLTSNTTSIVAVSGVVTISTNISRMDPILCTISAATCISYGWTVNVANHPGWNGTFAMTSTSGNWNADGTGGGNSIVYTDTINNPNGTLCSSLSTCSALLATGDLTFASLGYKITNIGVGDGVYATNFSGTDTNCTTQGYATTSPTTPIKAVVGDGGGHFTNQYGTGPNMTVVWPSSGTGAANCLISNAPGPPNGVTFQNNTLLSINRYAITNFGQSWWPINNWFWNNVFADNPAGVASDIECNHPVGGGFGEGTQAFTCWDSQTLEVYKNAFMGHSSTYWNGGTAVDPLGQCSSGCSNSFPSLAGGYPSGSCTYDGSHPLDCPMMALPWSTNFSLSNVAAMSGNPPSTQGVNVTQLTNTATANIYTCPAGLSCGSHGPYPDH